jgi:hypothetical protein
VRENRVNFLIVLLSILIPVVAIAETIWVPAVAHVPGVGTSRWRTDVGVLNLCSSDAVVEIRLHTGDGLFSETFTIPAGEQQIFPDVVTLLTSGDTSGALELRSNVGVTVTSRTYNQAATGTFGMGLDGVGAEAGLDQGGVAFLQQLGEDPDFRTNIGALNMGGSAATVGIALFERNGALVGEYQLEVPAGETVQDDRPYRRRFGRREIVGGYARVTVDSGSGIYPYATVIDNESDDPTAVLSMPAGDCPADIADRLRAIEGMTVTELDTDHDGYRYFELRYRQPADHDEPDGEQFSQFMTLLHRSHDAPMILRTLGYQHRLQDRKAELTAMLGANQLVVEHRFFDGSTPSSGDWELLDILQAAADHHRIVAAMKPLYTGAWINTGHSKGGMTAVFHRRFYPDDVDATVAYVAPITFGAPDDRYLDFLANVGTPACNEDLWAIQREALTRRQAMLDRLASYASGHGFTYDLMGGQEPAFESVVMELPFTFWQYAGETFCWRIPETTASDDTIFDFIEAYVGWDYVADWVFDRFGPYFYQAHAELGFPAVATDHIEDLMHHDPPSPEEGVPPPGSNPVFDPAMMTDIGDWVASEGERLMFIYGEYDPWTAAAFDLGDAADSYVFIATAGTHGARIGRLESDDRETAMEILHRWTGVAPLPPGAAKAGIDRYPEWRRALPDRDRMPR